MFIFWEKRGKEYDDLGQILDNSHVKSHAAVKTELMPCFWHTKLSR